MRPYPLPDAHLETTSILDHSSYLAGFDDVQWYLDNIPFIDVPDQQLQDVYYYRASVIKRHLKYVHESHGFIFTEFIHPVSWGIVMLSFPCNVHDFADRSMQRPNFKPFQTAQVTIFWSRAGYETPIMPKT